MKAKAGEPIRCELSAGSVRYGLTATVSSYDNGKARYEVKVDDEPADQQHRLLTSIRLTTRRRMKTRSKNRTRRALAGIMVTVASLGVAVATATPAVADGSYSGRAAVWGSGAFANDWDDEGVNNVRTHRYSNATCLWQMVLHSDGYVAYDDADGIFGDQTHAATVRWQRDRGLTADGSVGRRTWAKAGDRLRDNGSFDGKRYAYYAGTLHSMSLRRTSAGHYQFSNDRVWHTASYNKRTCR